MLCEPQARNTSRAGPATEVESPGPQESSPPDQEGFPAHISILAKQQDTEISSKGTKPAAYPTVARHRGQEQGNWGVDSQASSPPWAVSAETRLGSTASGDKTESPRLNTKGPCPDNFRHGVARSPDTPQLGRATEFWAAMLPRKSLFFLSQNNIPRDKVFVVGKHGWRFTCDCLCSNSSDCPLLDASPCARKTSAGNRIRISSIRTHWPERKPGPREKNELSLPQKAGCNSESGTIFLQEQNQEQ